MNRFKRIFVIVIDSLGVGEMPDSHLYGDQGTNTLQHLSFSKPDFSIPTLAKLGIGNITKVNNTPVNPLPLASYGKMKEISVGKDTLTGHWEIMGLEVKQSFPTFTNQGFPSALIEKLEVETGHKFIGNYAASGTEIIKTLGEEHLKTKALILYTSADSVLQIAAHEEIIPLQELYRVCEVARKITLENPEWMVGRIIARPFIGQDSSTFKRTANRHDYAVKPFDKTVLDHLKNHNFDVIAIGKINDIFDGEGITKAIKTKNNHQGMEETIAIAETHDFHGLCFVNLVDFDALYGHRRDAIGYATCLEEFDQQLGILIRFINEDDLLIICADHGNDPLHTGTDHTREYVLLLAYSLNLKAQNLGIRETFSDIGATILDNFNLSPMKNGTSFLKKITKGEIK
ncbi:MAG TPA: phosphopentomutase [Bacilli bacterium]|nr:phosphopentomutase [Bacilli bacterium]